MLMQSRGNRGKPHGLLGQEQNRSSRILRGKLRLRKNIVANDLAKSFELLVNTKPPISLILAVLLKHDTQNRAR